MAQVVSIVRQDDARHIIVLEDQYGSQCMVSGSPEVSKKGVFAMRCHTNDGKETFTISEYLAGRVVLNPMGEITEDKRGLMK